MSVNNANTPDGRGVLIFNGEMILVYSKEVVLSFERAPEPMFKGKKYGNLYLTSHRIIFINTDPKDPLRSFSMPFHCMKGVKLEQPIFGGNYLTGQALAQPDGNFNGDVTWRLTFNRGGCIEFGQSLLKANDMANSYRPRDAPPAYAPPPGTYYSPPPSYYMPQAGQYNGFQAPLHAFPDQPEPNSVFMYEQPPPYPGIGPDRPPNPTTAAQSHENTPLLYPSVGGSNASAPPYPAAPPAYNQASALPAKPKVD
ncbi:WW-domain-binding protein [Aphelenchoides avenae]|nr:WW-domain-binding protein [Aphelenchus avenae]